MFGIPVKGTHAHSWIMSFDDELEAFQAYAKALPNNCVFLVDTYDTLQGVKKAAEVGKWLRQQGHEMLGVRLDSGDLASLSIETRKILDEEGFPDAKIIASNELDERLIEELKAKGAKIAIWGVGTKLITGYDQPALGGVYKLSAVRAPTGDWKYKIKLSEQELKISNPGIQQVRRYTSEGKNFSDVIFDIRNEPAGDCVAVDMQDGVTQTKIPEGTPFTDLLVPIFRHGKRVYHLPSIHEVKEYAQTNLSRLHPGVKRLTHPDRYSVGIEKSLYELKTELIRQTRAMTI
jgi:nicotinate phosphoribosyltransferase